MKKLSLKTRLILSFFAASTLIMSSAGVLSWLESREQIDEFFDTYQILLARQLSTAHWHHIGADAQEKVDTLIDNLHDDGEEEDEAIGFAIFDAQGKMIFHDDENGKNFAYRASASGFENQEIGRKKKAWRILWLPTADKQHKIAVGQELEYRNEMALDLIEEFLAPWLYGLGVLLLLVIWLVHRELKPLRKIAGHLQMRRSNDFSLLEQEGLPKEILPLTNALNQLFVRIEEMLKRERSFIADSAHELRSPLTALKVQLEVLELSEDDKEEQAKVLKNLKTGIERSTRLVEQLLALSRLEGQAKESDDELLDWQKMLTEVIAEQEENLGRPLDIEIVNLQNCTIRQGQGLLWSLLMRNLLDNAVRYSPKDTKIKIEFNAAGVIISNSRVCVAKDDLLRLSERFFRPAGQKMSGSGLGLSIVEKIASLHGYRIAYENIDNVFRVRIEK